MPQPLERLPVLVVLGVLDAGNQDNFAVVAPDLHPQMVKPVFVEDLLEVACEPVEIAVAKHVLLDPFSGLSKSDPRLGNDAELSLATPHRIEEVRVPDA